MEKKINNNILKWYKFRNDSKILQLGNDITLNDCNNVDVFLEYSDKVLSDIKYKYDYIIIFDNINLNIINKAKKLLKDNGILLNIFDNPFKIENFSKVVKGNEIDNINLSKFDCDDFVKKLDMKHSNIYYPFPNYKICSSVIKCDNLEFIKQINDNEYLYVEEKEIVLFNELNLLKKVERNNKNIFSSIVNSYFIESFNYETYNTVRCAFFNNLRKEKYQLVTLLEDEIVEKLAINEQSVNHLKKILDNQKFFDNQKFVFLDSQKNNSFFSKRIKNEKSFDIILGENKKDINKIYSLLNDYFKLLYKDARDFSDEIYENLNKQLKDIDKAKLSKMKYLKNAFWDMIPKNCFYIDGKYAFYDQEWMENELPVEFLIYRSIINSYDLIKNINVEELFEKFDIVEYIDDFKKLDYYLRSNIFDDKKAKKDIIKVENIIYDNNVILQQKEELENKENWIKKLEKENENKESWISKLEGENVKKENWIKELEEENKRKEEYIKNLEEIVENLTPKRRRSKNGKV